MGKSISIVLIMILFGGFAYDSPSKEPTDTLIIDKNGKAVEPISGHNNNLGH